MTDASDAATRIRSFSRSVWIVGAIGIAIVGIVVFPTIGYDPQSGELLVYDDVEDYGRYNDYPWQQASPRQLPIVDGRVQGDRGGGYVDLPANSAPLALSPSTQDRGPIGVALGPAEPEESGEWVWPELLGYTSRSTDITYVVPGRDFTRLWFDCREDDWAMTVVEVDAEPVESELSGTGNAILEYSGDALSATFTHSGSGFFRVRIATSDENELAVNEVDETSKRASWPTAGTTLFIIESSGGSWSVRINE